MKTLLFVLILLASTSVFALPEESFLQYQNGVFSYYGSHSLTERNEKIKEAIIVVHGSERNADTYYKSIEAMAKKYGQSEQTLIISTHYKLPTDKLLAKEFTFTDEGWLSGDPAVSNSSVSSFEIMDHLLTLLSDSSVFPSMKRITLTGHSAGGQLTQRYAVATQIDQKNPKMNFRFIVANPGSYVYLTSHRPLPVASTCTYYDNYKYGLQKLNKYLGQLSVPVLITNYIHRDVTYLIGEKDIIADDIDQDCPAVPQGHTRLERGQNFKMQLDQEFPHHQHSILIVPSIGHTQWGMYTSEIGSKLLFEK